MSIQEEEDRMAEENPLNGIEIWNLEKKMPSTTHPSLVLQSELLFLKRKGFEKEAADAIISLARKTGEPLRVVAENYQGVVNLL